LTVFSAEVALLFARVLIPLKPYKGEIIAKIGVNIIF
jgi:hypothetical protein